MDRRAAKSPIRTRISAIIRTFHDLNSTSPIMRRCGRRRDAIDAPIDILINNAGIIGPERQSTLDMDFDGFAKTLAVNTLAPLAVAQAFLPHLKKSANPRILTISSQDGTDVLCQV
jgi:NAD(P)-dependent dehydrogenase (short-subunit alcohol dehydrogenase family)